MAIYALRITSLLAWLINLPEKKQKRFHQDK